MSNFIPSNLQNLLNEYLSDAAPMVLARKHPSIDRIKKISANGFQAKQPIITGYGGGSGNTYTAALANAQQGVVTDVAFQITPAIAHGVALIDWTTVPYTRGSEHSVLDVSTEATKAAMYNCMDNFCTAGMFGDGSGTLGTISSATNTSGSQWSLVLTNATQVTNFTSGQVLVSAASTSSGLDTGSATVLGTNPMGATILVDVGATGMTPTANHILGLQSQLNSGTNFSGIFGFVPTYANRTNGVPNVSPFLGVTRDATSMVVAVSGWAFNISGQDIFYGLNQSAGLMASYKQDPDVLFVNPYDLPRLAQALDQKVRYDMPSKSGQADVLYSGFDITLTTGKCEVLGEPSCPAGTAVLTKAECWILATPDAPFSATIPGQIFWNDYNTTNARAAVNVNGFFFTNIPSATACIQLY